MTDRDSMFIDLVYAKRILARLSVDTLPKVGEVLRLSPESCWRVVSVRNDGAAVVVPVRDFSGRQRIDEGRR